MDNSLLISFWINIMISPVSIIANSMAIVVLIKFKDVKKHFPIASLSFLDIILSISSFIQYMYLYLDEKYTKGDGDVATSVIYGISIPIYVCYILHMYYLIMIQLFSICYGYRSKELREKHSRNVLIGDIIIWILSLLVGLTYLRYDVEDVFVFFAKYITLIINVIYLILLTSSHLYIYQKVQRSRKRLSGTRSNASGTSTGRTPRVLKLYFLFLVSYLIFATAALTAYSIVFLSSNDGTISDTARYLLPVFVHLWSVTSPFILIYSYYNKKLKDLYRRYRNRSALNGTSAVVAGGVQNAAASVSVRENKVM